MWRGCSRCLSRLTHGSKGILLSALPSGPIHGSLVSSGLAFFFHRYRGARSSSIERRASSAYRELQEAWHFQHVIANHDGEDSDNWEAFYHPIGDARKSLEAFASLLQGVMPAGVERWEEDLVP